MPIRDEYAHLKTTSNAKHARSKQDQFVQCFAGFAAFAVHVGRSHFSVRYTGAMAPLDGLRVIDLTRVVAGPVLHDDARRHGRRGPQDRGAEARRRLARLGPVHQGLGQLLPRAQPQQEKRRARSEVARRRGRAQAAGRNRRRADRELQAGQPGGARVRLRRDVGAQPAADLLLDLGLRPDRSRRASCPATTP